jgi:hypothetical protein
MSRIHTHSGGIRWGRPVAIASAFLVMHLASHVAHADLIESFTVNRLNEYVQTSSSAPTDATGRVIATYLFTDEPGVITSGEVTYDGPASPLVLQQDTPGDVLTWYEDINTLSQAEFDAKYPLTTYTFTVNGPSIGTQSASLTLPVDGAPPAVPLHLTGDSYDRIQLLDPSVDFLATIDPWALPDWATEGFGWALIIEGTEPTLQSIPVFEAYFDNTAEDFLVPQGTLSPGTQYTLWLLQSNDLYIDDAGFDGATGRMFFGNDTYVSFRTAAVPEPSSFVMVGSAAAMLAGYVRFRRSRS